MGKFDSSVVFIYIASEKTCQERIIGLFVQLPSHIAAAGKINSKRVATTVSEQRSKTTENACVKCGIVYHNGFTTRTRNARLSGKNLLKRIAIPRFYQENILTNTRVCVIIFSASDTRSFAAITYLGV